MEVFEFLTKIGNMLYLSFLWFVCCIPIVTIGTSTTAYCYMIGRILRNEEGYITRGFFSSFKENFKISTKIWMIFIVAIFIVATDYRFIMYMSKAKGGIYDCLVPAYIMIVCLLWGMLIYAFPYMSRFNDTVKNILKNSFLMSTRHFISTILMMLLDFGVIFVSLYVFAGVLLISPVLIGTINMLILGLVFRRYENPDRYEL